MTDDDMKKIELQMQQQYQQQQHPIMVTSSDPVPVAVQVLGDHLQQKQQQAQQAQQQVVVHVVGSPTPSVLRVHHNAACCCCYPITPEDPIEILYARRVAIVHICLEAVGGVFMHTWLCFVALLLGVVSSSFVACCFKGRNAFAIWSAMGVLLLSLHTVAAVNAIAEIVDVAHNLAMIIFSVNLVLGGVCLLVVHAGWKAACAVRAAE